MAMNAHRQCTRIFALVLVALTTVNVMIFYFLRSEKNLLPDREKTREADDRDGERGGAMATRRDELAEFGASEIALIVISLPLPERGDADVVRTPATGGFSEVRISQLVLSAIRCMTIERLLVSLRMEATYPKSARDHDADGDELGDMRYYVRENRNTGTAYVELHGDATCFSKLVWCKFFALVLKQRGS